VVPHSMVLIWKRLLPIEQILQVTVVTPFHYVEILSSIPTVVILDVCTVLSPHN
jgi:hypothetical protein